MSDDIKVDAPKTRKHSALSRVSAVLGIVSIVLMAASIAARLIGGTGKIGLTGYGERLAQRGIPILLASALDFGNATEVMIGAMFLGLIGLLVGLIAVFLRGRKSLAVTGIITSLCTVAPPLLLPLL